LGTIYNAFNLFTYEEVAIKVDVPDETFHEPCALPHEAKIYHVLQGHRGFPSIQWHGDDRKASIMVMEQLGPTLNQLRRFCRGRFSMKTICMLSLQMVYRNFWRITQIESAHLQGMLVRDIEPSNCAMGTGVHRNVVYLFDFGVSKLYVDPTTGRHISLREGRSEVGTPRYASHNTHFGRDTFMLYDIEAFGITLLFFSPMDACVGRVCTPQASMPSCDASVK
ncbi:kinase-like protein, partial [Obba rivulosa]